MNIRSLIQIAVVVGTIAIGTGKLPKILQKVRRAQIVLIQESRTETWGKAMLLPVFKQVLNYKQAGTSFVHQKVLAKSAGPFCVVRVEVLLQIFEEY